MTNLTALTTASTALLVKIITNAEYESYEGGASMMQAYMTFTSAERGNLADLKKKGFVETVPEDGSYWVLLKDPARPLYDALKK